MKTGNLRHLRNPCHAIAWRRRVRIILFLAFFFHSSFSTQYLALSADIAREIHLTINLETLEPYTLPLQRGESADLVTYWKNYGSAKNLTNATAAVLFYRPITETNTSWRYAVTGSVDSITGGVTKIRWTSLNEATNTKYYCSLAVLGPTTTIVSAQGLLTLASNLAGESGTNATPREYDIIDWLTVQNLNSDSAPFIQKGEGGSGDMMSSTYDPSDRAAAVAFASGLAGNSNRITALEGYTNSAAQGAAAYAWGNHASAGYASASHNQAWSTITNTPTTIAGYGLTDAVNTNDSRLTDSRTPLAHDQAWSTITNTPTTLSGYGITDAATSAQGALADTALQPGDSLNAANLTNRTDYIVYPFYATNGLPVWIGPWAEERTLVSVFGKSAASTITVDIIEQASTADWNIFSTNLSLVCVTNGTTSNTFTDSSIAIGNLLGIQINSTLGTNGILTIKQRY